MTGLRTRRLLAAGLGTLLAGAVAWALFSWFEATRRAEYEAQRARIYGLVDQHAREPKPAPVAPAPAAERTPESLPYFLGPEIAPQLFPRDHATETYDPWCYMRHKPGKDLKVPWPEYPGGEWHWVTNSLGLREDREIAPTKSGVRILVTGDSHTDGFCDNRESFPHQAERILTGERGAGTLEVLNAGNGGFCFYNYLGVLERFLDYAPDAFVVAFYPGNDFQELVVPDAWFEHRTLPDPTPEQQQQLAAMKALSPPATVQFFHSLQWSHLHPDAAETSLATATGLVEEMHRICEERGIRFLCMLIPTAIDVPHGDSAELFEKMRLACGLSEEDLGANDRMADELLARVAKLGCETLDTRPLLRAGPGPWYWKKDFHLNLAGHAVLAKALSERIESWGGRFAR